MFMKSFRKFRFPAGIFIIPAIFILFFSCSSSDETSIAATNASLVFDYTESKFPEVYLSVFVQTENEAQRTESLKILDKKNNLSWTVTKPVLISNDKKNWAGYPLLKPADSKNIENGEYEILYTDAAGNEASSTFTINYDSALLETEYERIKNVISSALSEITIIYDKNMNMLFYGTAKKSWKNNASILREYGRAVFKRTVLTSVSGNLVFKSPLENLVETGIKK